MMKKIVLYNPQADKIYWKKGNPPLALLAISSYLAQEGYDIKIFDFRQKEALLGAVAGSICLGVTCMTGYQIFDGLNLASAVRKKYPGIPIVWGGWHPTLLPAQTIQNPYVDIVVQGQGEKTFPELVHILEVRGGLSKIPGIVYKEDGKIFFNPPRQVEDINAFPPLPYQLIDIDKYAARTRLGSRTIGYITSYGCPFRCGFCAEQMVNGRIWNALKPQRVVVDIRNLVINYGIDSVIISDSNFFVDEKRVRDICAELKSLAIVWGQVNGRADTLSHYSLRTWELMKESGLRYILTGAESGTQECLDIIQKEATVQDTLALARVCSRYGIRIQFSLFIGAPSLKKRYVLQEEINSTVDLIYQLHQINKNNEFLTFVYAPYPGTPLYEVTKQLGFKEPVRFEDWADFDLNERHIPWVSDRQAKFTRDLSYYLFFISGSLHRTIRQYCFVIRVILTLAAMPFYLIALFRFKYKFFSAPVELFIIRFILIAKNSIQELIVGMSESIYHNCLKQKRHHGPCTKILQRQ